MKKGNELAKLSGIGSATDQKERDVVINLIELATIPIIFVSVVDN